MRSNIAGDLSTFIGNFPTKKRFPTRQLLLCNFISVPLKVGGGISLAPHPFLWLLLSPSSTPIYPSDICRHLLTLTFTNLISYFSFYTLFSYRHSVLFTYIFQQIVRSKELDKHFGLVIDISSFVRSFDRSSLCTVSYLHCSRCFDSYTIVEGRGGFSSF